MKRCLGKSSWILAWCFCFCGGRSSAAAAVGDNSFSLPPPPYPNVTQLTYGYNPWMDQYTGVPKSDSTTVPTIVLLTGGCLPLEEGGSDFYQDAETGFREQCSQFVKEGIQCQCRPVINPTLWNPPQADESIYEGMAECVWEIRRLLDEHRRGLLNVGGISAKCSYEDPSVFAEAEALGVPLFLMGVNQPFPGEPQYDMFQPTGFIGTDQAFLGRTMARLLKQLRPEGGTYAFLMSWSSVGMGRRRLGFVEEMEKDNGHNDRPQWHEVEEYPFDITKAGFNDCPYFECMMERLADPATGADPTAIIPLFQSPLRHPNYTDWVDRIRYRNITIIAMDALDYLWYLGTGYVDGLVGQITYEMGKVSAQVLAEAAIKGIGPPNGVRIPPETRLFESRLVAYNLIPLELEKVYPLQLEENLLESSVVVGYACFGIVILSAALCLAWTLCHRTHVIVKAAQPFFLLVLLLGVVILSSTLIPLSFDDNGDPEKMKGNYAVGICMSIPWLAFTGFSIVFSALFSKTWRVNKLFHRRHSHLRLQVSTSDVLAPFAVLFTANVVVLICWTVIDPLTYVRQVGDGTDFWNREIESYGSCNSDKALAFLIPLALINFAVLAIACWQAFEARNLESEFAESRYIGLSVACLFQAFLTALPVVAIVKDESRSFYLVLTLSIFVLSEAILMLIFLPKMYLALQYSAMSEKEQKEAMAKQIHESTKANDVSSSKLFTIQDSRIREVEAEALAEAPEQSAEQISIPSASAVDGSSKSHQIESQSDEDLNTISNSSKLQLVLQADGPKQCRGQCRESEVPSY
eukprot:scaffold162_cov176-Amphora_coffeaeformis.AAC.30